jgi:hypothetical protein
VTRGITVFGAVLGAALGLGLGACTGDLDPAWQLDHDRIIAVRATPPGITSGQTSTIDALLGAKGGKTRVAPPDAAMVVSPTSLADVVAFTGGQWVVTAPSEDRLAAARTELKLATGAPVPLQVEVAYTEPAPKDPLVAVKTITLGQAADNPTLAQLDVRINDQPAMFADPPAAESEIIIGKLINVPLSIDVDDTDFDVAWLTSCGTMHDFDLPKAHLQVEADDPEAGELGVVLRDAAGGVAWNVWPIQAQ